MKKTPTKLMLKRDTLRVLTGKSLVYIVGGGGDDTNTFCVEVCVTKLKSVNDPER